VSDAITDGCFTSRAFDMAWAGTVLYGPQAMHGLALTLRPFLHTTEESLFRNLVHVLLEGRVGWNMAAKTKVVS
jgi:hypothetical protein